MESQDALHTYYHESSQRFADYYVNYLQENEHNYTLLEPEIDNILAALHAANVVKSYATLLRGSLLFYTYCETKGLYALARTQLEQAEVNTRGVGNSVHRVVLLLRLAITLVQQGHYEAAERYIQIGLANAPELQRDDLIQDLLGHLGEIAFIRGENSKAQRYWEEGLAVVKRHSRTLTLFMLRRLGKVAERSGQYAKAQSYWEEALSLAKQKESRENTSALLNYFGILACHRGDYDGATIYFQDGLQLAHETGHRLLLSHLFGNLGILHIRRCQYEQARASLEKQQRLSYELGHRERIGNAFTNLAYLELHCENYQQAANHFQSGLQIVQQLGDCWQIAQNFLWQGEFHHKRQCWTEALISYQQALSIAEKAYYPLYIGLAYYGIARVLFAQGQLGEAQRLGQQSLVQLDAINHADAKIVRMWVEEKFTPYALSSV